MNLLSSAISQPSEVYSSTAVSFAFCCVLLPCSNKKFYLLCASFPLHFLLWSFQSYRTCYFICWMNISFPLHSTAEHKCWGCHPISHTAQPKETISRGEFFLVQPSSHEFHCTKFTVQSGTTCVASAKKRIASSLCFSTKHWAPRNDGFPPYPSFSPQNLKAYPTDER